MPLTMMTSIWVNGWPEWMPDGWNVIKGFGAFGTLVLTKMYCNGARNPAERDMHGKVIMITGGTSGVGAAAALELARRGGQIILLTRQPASDPFLVEYIEDLRAQAGHQMVYAEQVDLESLHSIRQFATRWIDNAPPRRIDAIVLAAATLTPPGGARSETAEGIERTWMVNFLANFHLLGILSPALRAQPFDRDVRVVMLTCSSYIRSPPLRTPVDPAAWSPGQAYARSKLALMTFGRAFQKHLDSYKRPDGLPMNSRVVFVDPGLCRSTGTTRWITRGSLLGLLLYAVFYAVAWLLFKSPHMGAQSILFALMDGSLGFARAGPGGRLVKECRVLDFARRDLDDEELAKELWESSDALIEKTEKEQAKLRTKRKKETEEAEKAQEIEGLVDAIKKGKAKEAQKDKSKENEKPKPRSRRKA